MKKRVPKMEQKYVVEIIKKTDRVRIGIKISEKLQESGY